MHLRDILPNPKNVSSDDEELDVAAYMEDSRESNIPPYGKRQGWQPMSLDDFGDGGAYPEIDILQFPLNMGRKETKKNNALPVTLNSNGEIQYDALLRHSDSDKKKIIHYKYEDIVPVSMKGDEEVEEEEPNEDEIRHVTERTREALEAEVNSKIAASLPTRLAKQAGEPEYIRYTPAAAGGQFNSGARQRIIKMMEAQRDPMSPPRFKINGKVPPMPRSPPAPVMHSPPRKVTVQEQNDWKIPPCISSWKNPKGYVIPLDKRLATDGRGLHDTHINDKFAKLAEALYITDRKAREAVEMRSQMEKRILQKQKDEQEEKLRNLAKQARLEREAIHTTAAPDEEADERDDLRRERRRDRERERRMAKAGAEKRSAFEKEKDRDISEKIALGVPSIQLSNEAQFDQRLFNQSQGLDSGFQGGEDDIYNVYDQPWRKTENKSSLYRPSKQLESDIYGEDAESIIKTKRFASDKGLFGADEGATTTRHGPVQFEKKEVQEEDPFQLDQYLSEAKSGKRQRKEKSDQRSESPPHKKRRK